MSEPWILTAHGQSSRQTLDLDEVRRALGILAAPEYGIELRGLPSGRGLVRAGNDLDALVAAAQELADETGIYYTLNPIPVTLDHNTRVGDVYCRRWFFIDVDPVRPKDCSSSNEEHEAAGKVAAEISLLMVEQGWLPPMLIDSGNGWHLLARIDCPADEEHQALIRDCLRGLAAKFDSDKVKVDRAVHNASRIAKLPGTWAQKGASTTERPHRICRIVETVDQDRVNLTAVLHKTRAALLASHAAQEMPAAAPVAAEPASPWDTLRATGGNDPAAYGRKALESEAGRVAMAANGTRNTTLNAAAFSLGQLVAGGSLNRGDVEQVLTEAAGRAGLASDGNCGPGQIERTIRSGIESGMLQPRTAPERPEKNGHVEQPARAPRSTRSWNPEEPAKETGIADIARISDLREAGAKVQWLWPGWIQVGVLTAIAAVAGVGKTRFCVDMVRRIRHGVPWPDGAAMELPREATALWVMADNHHDEMVSLSEIFSIEELIYINATKDDPYGGVSLDDVGDLVALEGRIKALRPAVVIIDTVGNSTDKNLSKQEDAKAYYSPLQVFARRYRTAILCLTHLNASGQFLGRRVLEKVRLAIRMEQPDPDVNRRRVEVHKTNSKKPSALGLTMGDTQNDYDVNPPDKVEGMGDGGSGPKKRGPLPVKIQECGAWLKVLLETGTKRVSITRNLSEQEGYAAGTLYRAKEILKVVQYESEGKLWWRLPTDDEKF